MAVLVTFKKLYRDTAFILLNTVVLLIIINIALGVFYFIYDRYAESKRAPGGFLSTGAPVDNGKRTRYQLRWFDYTATTEVSPEHASAVLDDFYELAQKGFVFQPWVQFSEAPFAGKHVSVDKDSRGIPHRRTLNPQFTNGTSIVDVFVIGGSTTFGYHVADEHTWPSYLSAILNDKARATGAGFQIRVTNYGRGYYEPSQELALLINLLRGGYRPRLVVFMDGINLGQNEDSPILTSELAEALDNLQHGRDKISPGLSQWLRRWVPLARLIWSINTRGRSPRPPVREIQPVDPEAAQRIIDRFEHSLRMSEGVCRQFGVESLFFIQPDPVYNYPENLYRDPLPQSFYQNRKLKEIVYQHLRDSRVGINFASLFDAFGTGQGRKAIIDNVHYSPTFNRFLAERVAEHIDLNKLR